MSTIVRQQLPWLIGISGNKGVGKDTVANHLVNIFGFQRYSFADPIKRCLTDMFDVPRSLFDDPSLKETPSPLLMGRSPRYLMQTLGTEWGRDMVISDLWVRLMLRHVETAQSRGTRYFVVPDVRFDGEAQAIKDAGGIIWEVTRPDPTYGTGDSHRSEAGIDRQYVDTVIENSSTMHMLFTQVGVALTNAARKLHRPDEGSTI